VYGGRLCSREGRAGYFVMDLHHVWRRRIAVSSFLIAAAPTR
jgi:hypothetical protein